MVTANGRSTRTSNIGPIESNPQPRISTNNLNTRNSNLTIDSLCSTNNSSENSNSSIAVTNLQMLKDPAKFCGKENEDFMAWLEDFNAYIKRFNISPDSRLSIFRTSLGGNARTALDGFELDEIDTYEKICDSFQSVFAPDYDVSDWLKRLHNLSQNQDENIRLFAQRVRRHVQKALSDCSKDLREKHSIVHFIKGLKPDISKKLQHYTFKTLTEAIDKSIHRDTEFKNKKPRNASLNLIECDEEESEEESDQPSKIRKISSVEMPKRNGGSQQVEVYRVNLFIEVYSYLRIIIINSNCKTIINIIL